MPVRYLQLIQLEMPVFLTLFNFIHFDDHLEISVGQGRPQGMSQRNWWAVGDVALKLVSVSKYLAGL